MHSCIYEGTLAHRRFEPLIHQFQYRLFMVYLDLDELPSLVGRAGLIGNSHYATRSFLRSDHLFDSRLPLAEEVREIIRRQTGRSTTGPIRMLTQLRYFGFYMSPLNLFYVFDHDDERVDFVVAEVNNTPWNERHCYVLWDGNRDGEHTMKFSHRKEFHVSPFMDMEMQYRWQLLAPGDGLDVRLANFRNDRKLFDAGMTLRRRELNRSQLRRMAVRFPMMTAQITAAIYYQALKLWWKKCPFYPHPKTRRPSLNQQPSTLQVTLPNLSNEMKQVTR